MVGDARHQYEGVSDHSRDQTSGGMLALSTQTVFTKLHQERKEFLNACLARRNRS